MIMILVILAATRAPPVGLRSPPSLSPDQLQACGSFCDDPNGYRLFGDIILICVLGILSCTWASMHLDIPSPDERWSRVALRRAGLMLLALFVPEAVIAWTLRQRQVAAIQSTEKHKGEPYSQPEGFSFILVVAITLALGGIHCLGWSFPFPSSTERIL